MFRTFFKSLRRLLITVWFWFWAVFATIVLQISAIIFQSSSHDSITFLIEHVMASIIFLAMTLPGFWKVETWKVQGLEDEDLEDANGPFLLASNHNSIVDTLFIAMLPFRKSYTFNIKWSWVPIFGPLCLKAGYVGIDTSSPTQKAQVVPKITSKMQEGYSMMIYPQGTRSTTPTENLQASHLKHGTFTVAMQGKFKVLPIAILGTHEAMMRGGWCDVATIDIIIGRPFEVRDVEQGKLEYGNAINSAFKSKVLTK